MRQSAAGRERDERENRTLRLWSRLVTGALGGAVAIGIMEWFSAFSEFPLASIPFATSIVLVMGLPQAVPAQPRALVGGHLISALAGFAVLQLTGPESWAAALAVGVAIVAMHATGTFHPPAGINPLLIVTGNMPAIFLVVPVAVGALLLAAFAFVWHNIGAEKSWPESWW